MELPIAWDHKNRDIPPPLQSMREKDEKGRFLKSFAFLLFFSQWSKDTSKSLSCSEITLAANFCFFNAPLLRVRNVHHDSGIIRYQNKIVVKMGHGYAPWKLTEEQDAKPGKAKLDACPLNKTKDCLRSFLYSLPFPSSPTKGKINTKTKQNTWWGERKNPGDYPLRYIFR